MMMRTYRHSVEVDKIFIFIIIDRSTYWMLYDLPGKPDVNNVPDDEYLSPVGVNSLEVLDGHSYLFWYRFVIWDYE